MSSIIYNQYKGYCIPRGNFGAGLRESKSTIYTNGFNFFNWDDDELQQYSKPKQHYDALEDESTGDSRESSESIYDNEPKTHMNHDSISEFAAKVKDHLTPGDSHGDEDNDDKVNDDNYNPKGNNNKKGNRKKKQTKQEKKAEKRAKKKQKNGNDNDNDNDDFYIPSDVNKVKILNNLHKEILITINNKKIHDDDKVLQFFDVSIYKEDLDNLKDDEWLNDNNITFIYEYLERYQLNNFDKLVSNSIILLRPSMCYLLAVHPDPSELKGVLPPMENSKFIFLPVNDNDDVESAYAGSHWSLLVISILDKTAWIYDTLERANETEAKHVVEQISKYLGINFKINIMEKTPQQINGSDCGIMVGQITGFLLSRLLNLKYLEDHYVELGLNNVEISAIDGRIFLLGTLLNLLKHKQNQQFDE